MESIETTKAKNLIAEQFDELVRNKVFQQEHKESILTVIFEEGLPSDISINMTPLQSRWVSTLMFKYLDIKNENVPCALFQLVTSNQNDLRRYLVTAEDLTERGLFDFSPIDSI